MAYFTFPGWGTFNLTGLTEKELALTGAHGYATQAQAEAHPNAAVSPDQAALLQVDKAASLLPIGAGVSGVQSTPSGTGGISGLAGNLSTTFAANGDWRRLALRATEVAIGILLIITAANALTKNQPLIQSAKKVGKVLA